MNSGELGVFHDVFRERGHRYVFILRLTHVEMLFDRTSTVSGNVFVRT